MDNPQAIIDELRRENVELRAQLAAALEANRLLQERLDRLERASARQAAPFRRRESQKVPPESKKRPGRPPGHPGSHRPVPTDVDEHIDIPLAACPGCGGAVTAAEPIEQFMEEIPPVRPRVTRLATDRGYCACCGDVQTTHPLRSRRTTGRSGRSATWE